MRLLGKYSASERTSMLEIAVNAAAAGHDLAGFEPVQDGDGRDSGHQAECRRCGQTAFVSKSGLHYSLLDDACPGIGAN